MIIATIIMNNKEKIYFNNKFLFDHCLVMYSLKLIPTKKKKIRWSERVQIICIPTIE